MADYEPRAGWYSPYTQRILNGLPEHDKRRYYRESIGQVLTNAGIGRNHEHMWNEMERALRNQYVGTVELNQPDLVTRVVLPDDIQLTPPGSIRNYVVNSSFEVWPNQAALPTGWQSTGTGTVEVVDEGFVGVRALKLSAGASQSIAVYQDVTVTIPASEEWAFSAWYAIDKVLSGSLTAPATGFGIEAVGYLVDNTTETLRAAFSTDTGGHATKVSVTGSFTKTATKVRVRGIVTRSGAFDFQDHVILDLMQAEKGDVATSWIPNPVDNWPHVTVQSQLSPIVLESGNRMQFVEMDKDFWYEAIPTRAEYLTTLTGEGTADSAPAAVGGVTNYGTAGRFLEIDVFDEEWAYQFQAYDTTGSYKVRMIGSDVPDILGDYDLAFRNYRNWYEIDSNIELEAITYFGAYLWIVHKKYDLNSNQKRYLSVVDPKVPWPRPDYLECPVTIELPTPSLGTLITRAEFRYDDQQHIYLGDGSTTYVYNLYYDYFTISGRELFLREEPETITIVELEPTRREMTVDLERSRIDRSARR